MTSLSLEEKIQINNGRCHTAHQNSAREENEGGENTCHTMETEKRHTHVFFPADVGVFTSGINLFQAQNRSI